MPDKVSWSVVSQSETTAPDATGRFVAGVRVGFQTSNGLQGTVFVPDAQYSADYVQQLIQTRVDQMQGVQTLRG